MFPGRVAALGEAGAVTIEVGEGPKLSARWRSREPARIGEDAMVAFRADRVVVRPAAGAPAGDNSFTGEVEAAAFLGTCFDYTIRAGALQVQAEGPVDSPVARGAAVSLSVPAEQCHAFRADGGGNMRKLLFASTIAVLGRHRQRQRPVVPDAIRDVDRPVRGRWTR